ncbi:MAG TPA: CBS domain-containing protein [Actinospica sp.]|jgi:CBS domain-containing protein|nr:CBS domain-containing protein [Actinospica sp.]
METMKAYDELDTSTARDLMSPVDATISETATLREVVRRFLDGHARHLIVVDADGRCVGVIGPRLVAQAHRVDLRSDDQIPLRDLGHADWVALAPQDSIRTCARLLVEYDLDAIPVVDEEHRVLGIVTVHDIARVAAHLTDRAG